MSFLSFIKPEKIILQKSSDNHGLFEFKPLEPGFGVTVGNALRRVLLSSLEDMPSLLSKSVVWIMSFLPLMALLRM